jgi:hypothetical protein
MSTFATIFHAGVTLETNPTIIVSPVDTVFNTTTSIATGSYVITPVCSATIRGRR